MTYFLFSQHRMTRTRNTSDVCRTETYFGNGKLSGIQSEIGEKSKIKHNNATAPLSCPSLWKNSNLSNAKQFGYFWIHCFLSESVEESIREIDMRLQRDTHDDLINDYSSNYLSVSFASL